jgi:hypothetical protein
MGVVQCPRLTLGSPMRSAAAELRRYVALAVLILVLIARLARGSRGRDAPHAVTPRGTAQPASGNSACDAALGRLALTPPNGKRVGDCRRGGAGVIAANAGHRHNRRAASPPSRRLTGQTARPMESQGPRATARSHGCGGSRPRAESVAGQRRDRHPSRQDRQRHGQWVRQGRQVKRQGDFNPPFTLRSCFPAPNLSPRPATRVFSFASRRAGDVLESVSARAAGAAPPPPGLTQPEAAEALVGPPARRLGTAGLPLKMAGGGPRRSVAGG